MMVLAAVLAASQASTLAQAAEPVPTSDGAPKPSHVKRKPAKPVARGAPSTRSPILGRGGEDEAASLERRRKAFFAPKPDEGDSEEPSRPAAGVTLGGSGGISPGMGFKF